MWLEIFCGLIIYRLYRCFFSDDDDILDVETSDSKALFSVGERLVKLYGGKVYAGLRIPDADTATPQNIDLVLVSKGEAVVIAVKNFSGLISVNPDGSWVCEGYSKRKTEHHPDPVAETKKQASILESYLEQRGVALPEGYLSCKVVLSNPKVCTIQSSNFPSEVVTYDQWVQLKPEPKSMFSGWIKGAFRGGKKEMQESIHQKLNFILSTAPMWDRLELKGNKYVLGEFLEFKGKQEDVEALRNIKRSKISRLIVQKTSMLGFAPSRLQVLYSPRDYRSEGASASEWKEVNVRSSTEVLFQPESSDKLRKFKLASIVSMSLSA
ncbi:PREDICTED: Plasma membrane [Prunus dulcis]|uniref:PREDICTED: Plasma membrane n=1 Tax=Prunus dulcis TaxID=3755 RepID=A0A5E4E898_PRUDU|nr:uncharacterized protein LOC117619463 [Prunus dulcis]KAI5347366.1 hypothetical protein L3X38_015245 [Prunus dulcis]VVA11506.1 PREDICTED: Plasma membrane [Prunus dulcis]